MGRPVHIQSVSRAAAILRCFEKDVELGLTEISKMVGLHKSTAAGIIGTLKNENLLEQNEDTGKFRLGVEIFRLSLNIKMDLKDVCEPYLDQLLTQFSETVNLVQRDGNLMIYVEKKESPHSMRICTKIGQRLPMYCTAVGKAVLAFLPEDEFNEILDNTKFIEYTKNTAVSKSQLKEQAEEIRRRGYAYDIEELEYGLVCIATPIFTSKGRPIAGISVSGPAARMTEEVCAGVSKLLLEILAPIAGNSGGRYTTFQAGTGLNGESRSIQ